ncbi:MAG: PQQ-binding-like beta-propeller repeat protein [Candidatus Margulisiibacteriota bacterium]
MALLKRKSKGLTLLFLGLCLLGFASAPLAFDKVIRFPFRLVSPPLFYHNTFFAFTSDGKLIKLNQFGQQEWFLPKLKEECRDLALKFNFLFYLDKQGRLETYDANFGYRVWHQDTLAIQKLYVGYPYLYFLDKNGTLGSLDFFSGLPLWTLKPSEPLTDLCVVGTTLYVTHKGQLLCVDGISGKQRAAYLIPSLGKTHLLKGFEDGIVIEQNQALSWFNFKTKTLTPRKASLPKGPWLITESGALISGNPAQNLWSVFDLKANTHRFEKAILNQGAVKTILLGETELGAFTVNDNAQFLSYATGVSSSETVSIAGTYTQDYLCFFRRGSTAYIFTRNDLVITHLEPKKP